MFRKLYKNLLLLNVAVLSLLLFVIFSILYISTYQDITQRINNDLTNIIESYNNEVPQPGLPGNIRPERNVSILLVLDDNGVVLETISGVVVSDGFSESILEQATKDKGKITFEDETWSYQSTHIDDTHLIVLINSTNEHELLTSSLIRFIVIFIVSIGLTTLISSFITKKSILPVKESFDRQKQFVSDASHELKTPLTIINTNVDILLSEDETNSKWLKYIKSEVTRMSKLTHDLLYLANMTEVEKQNIFKTKVNISDKTESIVLGVEALAFEKNITIDYNITPDTFVEVSDEQFHQLVMILLDNAIKYTNPDGIISLSLAVHNAMAILKIKNSGEGIAEKDLEHIFDRFYKTDKSRENKSNSYGLGLSIAKAICDNNNAKLTVHSRENEFTEFQIKIKTI